MHVSEPQPTVAPIEAETRASPALIAVYAIAYTATWLALLTPIIVTLALRIRELTPDRAAESISLVLSVGALFAMVSNPIFGALSDRTTSRFGRRRPWLIGGALLGCASLALVGWAPSVTLILIGWCCAQLAFNAVLAAMAAILPDQVPASQRGTVAGVLGVCMPLGQIAGTFLVQIMASSIFNALVVPAAIAVVAIVLLAIALPDKPLHVLRGGARSEPQTRSRDVRVANASDTPSADILTDTARSQANSVRGHEATPPSRNSDFAWAWLSRLLFVMGGAFLTAYQALYLIDKLGMDARAVPQIIFHSTLLYSGATALCSLIAGRLSDTFQQRKRFVFAGAIVFATGLCIIACADAYSTFFLGIAMTGVGHGVYVGVDLALVSEVLPDEYHHAAKDLGILNITNTLPQVIVPAISSSVLHMSRGDYTVLFLLAAALALLASCTILPVKTRR
jgi:MFS family permease